MEEIKSKHMTWILNQVSDYSLVVSDYIYLCEKYLATILTEAEIFIDEYKHPITTLLDS